MCFKNLMLQIDLLAALETKHDLTNAIKPTFAETTEPITSRLLNDLVRTLHRGRTSS